MITDYLFYYNKKLIGKEGDKKWIKKQKKK
jgi:hypothetical protein